MTRLAETLLAPPRAWGYTGRMKKLSWTAALLLASCSSVFALVHKPVKLPVQPPLPPCRLNAPAGVPGACGRRLPAPMPIGRPIGGPVLGPRSSFGGSNFTLNGQGNGGAVTTTSAFAPR